MAQPSSSNNIENLVRAFKKNDGSNQNETSTQHEHHEQWMNNSIFFRQITQDIAAIPAVSSTVQTSSPESNANTSTELDKSTSETSFHEKKIYSPTQFRSHINRLYPFHLDAFTDKLSALDFEQHRMGLYMFYDINQGHLINDLEKESNKKSSRAKNMKRMNGLLLNEHRLFNEAAKEYAMKHAVRDYEFMKDSINRFMTTWVQRKTDLLRKNTSLLGRYYTQRMAIPLNSYDGLTPVTFAGLSTALRVGTIHLLTVPGNIEQLNTKCSENQDRIVSSRFNPEYRLTSLADDPNILAIVSQNPSIDVVISKSSLHLLIELFSVAQSSMSLPTFIREFQFDALDTPGATSIKKKLIFIDKPIRQRVYTKRELNTKYSQRSFRSLLISTTGGKRETNSIQFCYTSFNNKTEFQITEIKKQKPIEKSTSEQTQDQSQMPMSEVNDNDDEEDEDEETAMIISTDGDTEEQQKLFNKSKKKIIHSAPTLQERDSNDSENSSETTDHGPAPVTTRVKLITPIQGNYEYSLWQLGTLQILIRSSFHGFLRHVQTDNNANDELITCYAKVEYQPQFGLEQITDREYRSIWTESYLRHGASVLLGRIDAFTQHLLKVEKMTYANIEQNLKECQIDMIKPLTKIYGLLYGLQSLEPNSYLLSCSLNDTKLNLYEAVPSATDREKIDLQQEPFETNGLLAETEHSTVPWVPLTATLLLPYHLDFERIPLTFCPRKERCYDIEIIVPAHRKHRRLLVEPEQKSNQDKKKRRKIKKKTAQRRKKKANEQSKKDNSQ